MITVVVYTISIGITPQTIHAVHRNSSYTMLLKRLSPADVSAQRRDPVDAETRISAEKIVLDVKTNGQSALLSHATRLGDIKVRRRRSLRNDERIANGPRDMNTILVVFCEHAPMSCVAFILRWLTAGWRIALAPPIRPEAGI